ncbi:MAG: hypothetical protein KDD50_05950 [Bdellovibrionales bacterium]|nr:hypothetical protein [Bdellovibrionales bacterium]
MNIKFCLIHSGLAFLGALASFSVLALISCSSPTKSTTEAEGVTVSGCLIENHSTLWEAGYCRILTNSDDKTSRVFQKCLADLEGQTKNKGECSKRSYYKEKICRHYFELGYLKKGVQNCMKNSKRNDEWIY